MPLALVTGANRGIGRGVAARLARLGYTVLLGSRDPAKGEAAAADLNADLPPAAAGRAVAVPLDVTSDDDLAAVAALIERDYGGTLHALVNNAAVDYDTDQSVLTADPARVERVWRTNTLAPMRLTQALASALRRAGPAGRVVNVTSGAGALHAMDDATPAYSLSKAGLNALTRQQAAALADAGTRVNACCPGWVRTAMGGPGANRSVEEGTESVTWGVTIADDGPTGGFFRDGKRQAW